MYFIGIKDITENDKMGRTRSMNGTDEQYIRNIISNAYAA
jgi:hypothetical protein